MDRNLLSPFSWKSNAYTLPNTNGERKMFIVLCCSGKPYVHNGQQFRKPPDGFDSVKSPDDVELVVYDNDQVYPEYLITYKFLIKYC